VSKPLPLSDFRAVRQVLEEHEYLTGGEDIPPSNLIERDTWDGIMHLPDDVAIKISNHNGSRLQLLYSLWGDWIEAVGDPCHPDNLFVGMLDAADCFQCATFDFLHGYYRAALANLRAALELVMIGVLGNLSPTNARYLAWKNGASELTFTPARKVILQSVKGTPGGWLLEFDKVPAEIFRDLCRFTHSRPDASDGVLWQSNGPVYNNEAIQLAFDTSLRVYAICYLLVKIGRPTFKLPTDSRILFELEWLKDHAQLVKAFRELGELAG
jgi:hypothetical protein